MKNEKGSALLCVCVVLGLHAAGTNSARYPPRRLGPPIGGGALSEVVLVRSCKPIIRKLFLQSKRTSSLVQGNLLIETLGRFN